MQFYKTTHKIRLLAGVVLALSVDQVSRRKHLLMIADGAITTRAPVEFKAGEIIGFEQEPRALLSSLEPIEFDDLDDVDMIGIGNTDHVDDQDLSQLILAESGVSGAESVGADSSAQDEVLNALDFSDGLQQAPNSSAALLDLPGEVIVNAKTDELKKGEIIESTIGERSDNADSGVQIQPGSGDFTPVPEAKPARKPAK